MGQSVLTLTGDTNALAAARLMCGTPRVGPVVDGDRVVGMVTRRDLLRLIARSDEDIRADLESRAPEELRGPARQAVRRGRDVVAPSTPTAPRPPAGRGWPAASPAWSRSAQAPGKDDV